MASWFTGVIIFSGSLPATRLAVQDMDPLLLTFLRASIAGLLAIALLVGFRQKRPRLAQLVSLIIVSSGVVLGFPLLTALALQRITSAHSIVFIGLLPLMTALFGVLRGGERPRRAFWIFFAAGQPAGGGIRPDAKCGGLTQRRSADAGGGYRLRPRLCGRGEADAGARRLAGDLLGAGDCPAVDAPRLAAGSARLPACHLGLPPRAALGYVSLFSMLIGFIFWYKGLAAGGIAAVGQLQLLQPFFGLGLSAALLHETVSPLMLAVTLGVVLCVVGSRKFARQRVGEENGGNN